MGLTVVLDDVGRSEGSKIGSLCYIHELSALTLEERRGKRGVSSRGEVEEGKGKADLCEDLVPLAHPYGLLVDSKLDESHRVKVEIES